MMRNPYASMAGQVAIITGGTGQVGSAVTKAFMEAEVKVALPYRSPHEWERFCQEIGRDATQEYDDLLGDEVDVANPYEFGEFVDTVTARWGRLDILVTLAGGYGAGDPVVSLSDEVWNGQIELNARTAFVAARACLPAMIEAGHGKIVMVSSRAAVDTGKNAAAYSISKAMVNKLVQAIAEEVKDDNIQVNAVMPSIIDTPANRKGIPNADFSNWPRAEQVAEVLLFLASSAADLISGAAIPIYGKA
jgi:NAD(P)-dependent dehydrogenase (short-subunit alcohol dehydrogenase family)